MLKRWTQDEKLLLKKQYKKIGSKIPGLKRSKIAIYVMAYNMDLTRKVESYKWCPHDINILKKHYKKQGAKLRCLLINPHTKIAIYMKANQLGLKNREKPIYKLYITKKRS